MFPRSEAQPSGENPQGPRTANAEKTLEEFPRSEAQPSGEAS